MSQSRRGRSRAPMLLAILFPLWALLLGRSFHMSWSFTGPSFPVEKVGRYEPLRTGLRAVAQADLLVPPDPRNRQRREFWFAQYALTPTVLTEWDDEAEVLTRARRIDPHYLVVALQSHEQFERFRKRYERRAGRHDRAVRVQDLGDGAGVLVSLSALSER